LAVAPQRLSGPGELPAEGLPARGRAFPGRWFKWVAVLLLAGMGWAQISSALRETQTIDESFQLVTGYAYVRNGVYTFGLEHPPLLKLLFGLAVRDLNPELPRAFPATPRDGGDPKLGTQFLYRNRVPADALLLRGRLVAIGVSLILGCAIAFVTARWFGRGAALLALSFYVLDPNILAHGRYIKNDVAAALGIFVVTAAWGSYLVSRKRSYLLASGLFLGLALSTKFSALVLLPILLIHALIRRWQVPRDWPRAKLIRSFAAAGAIAFAVIWAVYGLDVGTVSSAGLVDKARKIEPLRKLARSVPLIQGPLLTLANSVPIPAPLFFRGIVGIGHMNIVGRETYLLGKAYSHSPWYCSPVTLFVKTPAAMLGLVAAALILSWRRLRSSSWSGLLGRFRAMPFAWIMLAISPLLYIAITAGVRINAGVRSLLAVYPFVFIFVAAVLVRETRMGWARRVIVGAGLVALVAESVAIYPHYLSFFNILVGGPSNGPKYLLDSNIDWGQDAKYLKAYADSRRIRNLCLSYYGLADLDYYGVSHQPLPSYPALADLRRLDCVAAVSVTNLYSPEGKYESLRAIEPQARIGNSIYVYDLGAGKSAGASR